MGNNGSHASVDFKSRNYKAFRIAFFACAVVINFMLPRAAAALKLPL